jgi:hypothetical protein
VSPPVLERGSAPTASDDYPERLTTRRSTQLNDRCDAIFRPAGDGRAATVSGPTRGNSMPAAGIGRIGDLRSSALAGAPQPSLAGTQLCHRGRGNRRRFPAGNDSGVFACRGVVGDAEKPATHLDGGRQFSLLVEGSADRGGIGFADNKHAERMGRGPGSKPFATGLLAAFL